MADQTTASIPSPPEFMSLPPEIHLLIFHYLPFPWDIHLKLTSSYFNSLLPRLSHQDLLQAEKSRYATSRHLYACRCCLRLRSADQFARRMLERRRSRGGRDARKRFCVECGLTPRSESQEARYGRGAIIDIQGVLYVVCMACRKLGIAWREKWGNMSSLCEGCARARVPMRKGEKGSLGAQEDEDTQQVWRPSASYVKQTCGNNISDLGADRSLALLTLSGRILCRLVQQELVDLRHDLRRQFRQQCQTLHVIDNLLWS